MNDTPELPHEGELIFYQTSEGTVRIEVLYESETFWLNQKRIAELFGVEIHTVSYHLKEIYASGELTPEATLRKIRRVQTEGTREVRRDIEFYNLDAIISVGYRVNSSQATQFRIWATQTLREFIIKGFVLDDERLKLNKRFGKDYFDELLERIREIRASERRFYLKITDIYEQCSIDYDKSAENRHIYEYVFTDSKTERKFVQELDTSVEVVVYAKLPKSFYIPTPVGNYNPDWAIAFEEGKVKHIYFIAETKGSMSSMDFREIEKSKIECARKFFSKITSDQVKYDVVDGYGKLMELVQ